MKFGSVKILADENISPRILSFLRAKGIDASDVKEKGWQGSDDRYILEMAYADERFVLTHDSDFGTLAINEGAPCYGIIYIRLKNLKVENVCSVLEKLLKVDIEIAKGSIIVVEDARVRIRSVI
jgi:predicted nuclease of predicted toxin-antitoxin system